MLMLQAPADNGPTHAAGARSKAHAGDNGVVQAKTCNDAGPLRKLNDFNMNTAALQRMLQQQLLETLGQSRKKLCIKYSHQIIQL
jgi:hypothetical protein